MSLAACPRPRGCFTASTAPAWHPSRSRLWTVPGEGVWRLPRCRARAARGDVGTGTAPSPGRSYRPPPRPRRVFGFKDIILYRNGSRPNALVLNTGHPWPVYANPGILLLLYYTVATLVKLRRLDARVRGCAWP